MKAIGIICEYNPFHNGHLYHLKKVKELYKDSIVVLVLGGSFLQRGDISTMSIWDKTEIALKYGVDLAIELPFPFATQSADIFAKGSIEIFKHLKCSHIVFGSETNDIEYFKQLANTQLSNKDYDIKVKEYLDQGINYPTALSKALNDIDKLNISTPNDLLALSYVKEIIRQKADIEPVSIKRTNDYHEKVAKDSISSATSIRELLNKKMDIKDYVPELTYKKLNNYKNYDNNYFTCLKYKIISEGLNIKNYQTVDEGIENRILKYINECNTLEELIEKIKTKRYTYNKLKRMFSHILCSFTKSDAQNNKDVKYIRILGFNAKGKKYLNTIKKEISIPIIAKYNKLLDLDLRCIGIYNLITENIVNELSRKPIIIEKEI